MPSIASPSPMPVMTPTPDPVSPTVSVEASLALLKGLSIDAFFEQAYRLLQLRDPDALFINGLAEEFGLPNDRFTDRSDVYRRQTQQLEVGILERLLTYDRNALTLDQQLSYDIFSWYLTDQVQGHAFMYYDYPVNALTIWGVQNWLLDFMVRYQPIASLKDAQDYIVRLSQLDLWTEQLRQGLALRKEAGIIPPKYILQDAIDQIETHVQLRANGSYDVEAIVLYGSFRQKLDQAQRITASDKEALLQAARIEVEETFIPAYLALRDDLVTLQNRASNSPGVGGHAEGESYYAYLLHQQAGTNMSPDDVHALGISEVQRLQVELREQAAELGCPEVLEMDALYAWVGQHVDSLSGEALIGTFRERIEQAEQAASAYFNQLPSADLRIQPDPFGSGIGYYLPPPLDGSGPGVFLTNTRLAMPHYLIPSYVFHETIPGHHLQGALARESDLPTFRQDINFNAYAEGWAVYAEQLAWEMGLYADDPWGNLGRLDFELARAARLVIDTGLHAKGWTRQQSADYYEEATGRPSSPESMHRYIILPAQGCGYTIGLLRFRDIRQKAMDRLGDDFNIKDFHQVVLGQGPMPLDILEKVVDAWITEMEERSQRAIDSACT